MGDIKKYFKNDQMVTIFELSALLECSESLIREKIKKHYPDLIKNGIQTKLNEIQCTKIKLDIEQNPHLARSCEVKTDLEMSIQLREAALYFEARYNDVRQENEVLKPKAIVYDTVMQGTNIDMSECAKLFNIGRNTLFKMLRKEKILMAKNAPYQEYMKYFEVIIKPHTENGKVINDTVTLVRPSGIDYIAKKFNLVKIKNNKLIEDKEKAECK